MNVVTMNMVEGGQMAFNYDAVPAPVAIQAREAAERIKLRLRRSAEDIIEIGRDLIAVKSSIGHGNFLPWIESEFGMSDKTAQKMMQVAKVYGGKSELSSNLDPTALYELAAPKTPLEVREEVQKMIEAGEVVTKADVAKIKAEFEAAQRGKTLAEHGAGEAQRKLSVVQSGANEAVNIAVAKAIAEVQSEHEAELNALKEKLSALQRVKPSATIDNDTGKIIQFHKGLTEDEAAEIDAEDDEFSDADFNVTASGKQRALTFMGSIRSIHSVNASPSDVFKELTNTDDAELIEKRMAMVDTAFRQLKIIKDLYYGK